LPSIRTVPAVSSATPRLCRAPGCTTSTGRAAARAAAVAVVDALMTAPRPRPGPPTPVLPTSVGTSGRGRRLADRTPPDPGHVARGLVGDAVLPEGGADRGLLIGDGPPMVGSDPCQRV